MLFPLVPVMHLMLHEDERNVGVDQDPLLCRPDRNGE